MERIKRCMNCGSNNMASNLFCEKCGADISRLSVEFIDPEADENIPIISEHVILDTQEESFTITDLDYVKVCRCCGKISTCNVSSCLGCGSELIDIIDTEGKIPVDYANMLEKSNSSKYSMTIVSGAEQLKTMRLSNGLSVFGRIHLNDFENKLNCYQYISEIHCLISISDDAIEITDVSLNGTFLDNQRIVGKIAVGDETLVDVCGRECLSLLFRSNKA